MSLAKAPSLWTPHRHFHFFFSHRLDSRIRSPASPLYALSYFHFYSFPLLYKKNKLRPPRKAWQPLPLPLCPTLSLSPDFSSAIPLSFLLFIPNSVIPFFFLPLFLLLYIHTPFSQHTSLLHTACSFRRLTTQPSQRYGRTTSFRVCSGFTRFTQFNAKASCRFSSTTISSIPTEETKNIWRRLWHPLRNATRTARPVRSLSYVSHIASTDSPNI